MLQAQERRGGFSRLRDVSEFRQKRTKIVATIGPASRDPEMLRRLFLAGVNVVRLNFSHGTHDEHAAVIADVRRVAAELGLYIAILQDLPGPKVRTGRFAAGIESVLLENGAPLVLTTETVAGTAERIAVSYPGLANDVEVGKRIYLADGAIALRIESVAGSDVRTRVEVGGVLRALQGINYPDGSLQIAAVTERDFEHLEFGLAQDVDWVAVSFVRSAADITRVRAFMAGHGKNVPIIAKIEKHEALEDIDNILIATDAIMVARGDLGIETPLESVPIVQKDLIRRANRASKPVVTATQMLESMIASPRPTRAEATDVANAILDGTDAVMLSGETARGAYPLEAVSVMATIAREVEKHYPHTAVRRLRAEDADHDAGDRIATSIAEAAVRIADRLGLGAIVIPTSTGNTARYVSTYRPSARIIGMTPFEPVARRMALSWGVESLVVGAYTSIEALISVAEDRVVAEGIAASGETIVVTSGVPVGTGGTNLLRIHRLP